MGAMQNDERVPGKKRKSRGTVRNADRLAAFAKGGPADGADWGGCDANQVQAVVESITRLGGAVTFGMSRDKGAHSVTLLLDDNRKTLWFNGDADLSTELRDVAATLDAMK